MKRLIYSFILLFTMATAQAQTNATDFTANDCNGQSHHLFADLNAGKVVVMVWVMPCGACIGGAGTAYNEAISYATSNPGKVILYLMDDTGNDNCATISSWASTNGIDPNKAIILNNSGNVINETNFGGSGMPHIVVAAGNNHKIYFNQKNGTGSGVQAAIQTAIIASGIDVISDISFSAFPNPSVGQMQIRYNNPIAKVTVINVAGQLMQEEIYASAKTNPVINVAGMAPGIYFIRISDTEGKSGIQKIIIQ